MGNKTNTATQTSTPPAGVLSQYQALLNRASGVSTGATVAPLTDTQQQAIGSFNQIPSSFLPQASNYVQQGAAPITGSQISNYSNPFQQSVVNATMGNINETNAEQQQQVTGNAIAQGALGGNRVGVAQGELARQQGLANDQTFAGLNAGNYQQALAAAQQDRAASAAAAGAEGNLQTQALQGATAQLGAGTVQQQQNAAQLQQPYQQASWLASLLGGVGPLQGQTQKTTTPGPNIGSQILGGGLSLLGGFLGMGRGGGIQGYAAGGGPGSELGGLDMTLPMYAPIATAAPLAMPSLKQNQDTQGTSALDKGFGNLGTGLSALFSKSPDVSGGIGLGMGQIYHRGGAVHRADGGIIPPQSDVHRMVSSAIDIARTMKGGLGGVTGLNSSGGAVMPDPQGIYVPRGYDDGGTVNPGSFQYNAPLTPAQALAAAYYAPIANAVTPGAGAGAGIGAMPGGGPAATGAPMQLGHPQAPASQPQPQAPTPQPQPQSDPAAGGASAPPMGGTADDPSMGGADPNSLNGMMAGIGKQQTGRKAYAMPLMAAGLGMMASQSPFLGTAIGQGGLEALNYMQQQRNYDRQIAIAASQNAYRQQRADIADRNADTASQRLDVMAKTEQDRLGFETANASRQANVPESAPGKLAYDHARGLISDADYATAKSALPGGVGAASDLPNVSLDAKGTPNPDEQQAYLAAVAQKYGPAKAAQVKAVANGDQDITKVTSNRGGERQAFSELVTGFDNNWSTSLATRRGQVLHDLQSVRPNTLGGVVSSANTFVQHASDALGAIDKMGLSDTPIIGSTINAAKYLLQHKTGPMAPVYAQYETAADGMSDEFAKVLGSGVLSESQAKLWQDKFHAAGGNGPGALKAAISEAMTMMGQSVSQRHQTVADAFGGSRPDLQAFLKPDTVEKLKKIGVDPAKLDPKYSDYANAGDTTPTPANGGAGAAAASGTDPIEAEMRRRGLIQ